VYLGNLDALRDWGHARDYVEMQWLMLQQPQPEDFVIATGQQYSVREFVEKAAAKLDLFITWKGKRGEERGYDQDGRCIVRVDPRYLRPTEVDTLLGDPGKARRKLGWVPRVDFDTLVEEMVRDDLVSAERDSLVARNGYRVAEFHE
jgi:GDPmannose 4,6-dehydratase